LLISFQGGIFTNVESVNEAYADDLDESENIMLEKMRQHQRKLQ